jgi:UDP-glucuronate 4-epimerase
MNVLVTGAAGFIGSNLVDVLLQRGDEVVGLDNFDPHYDPALKRRNLTKALADPRFKLIEADILDASSLHSVINRWHPNGIVHLAARVSNRHSLGATDSAGYDTVNAGGTATLLAACAGASPRAFVFVSTGNVYDCTATAPFREGVTPDRPLTPYSRSKKAAESHVLDFTARNGLPATVLRLFTVYGPRQRPDMVHYRFASALLAGRPLNFIGAGSDLRDYIHINDACAAIVTCLDHPASGEIVNVGSGRGTTLDSLLELLIRFTGGKPLMRRQKAPSGDTGRMLADIAKAEQKLGWRPAIKLENGLEDFITWFQSPENSFALGGARHEN